MRKALLAAAFACLLTVSAFAQAPSLIAGTRELALSGALDTEGPSGTTYNIDVTYGYFIADNLEIGGGLAYAFAEGDPDDATTLGLRGLADYHFGGASAVVPYVGARVGWQSVEIGAIDEDAVTYGARGGIKYFIADNVGIDVAIQYLLASEDIFVNDGEVEDNDLSLQVGLRVLF